MQRNCVSILLVDDDAGHTELIRRNLKRAGINNPIDTVDNLTLV